MSTTSSESAIVGTVAKEAAKSITGKVIADLRRMRLTTSGDDSPLKTTWDEICVDVQLERSTAWGVLEDTVRAILGGYVAELPKHEREAIWFQTGAGIDWDCEEPEDRQAYPVYDDDIVDYLAREYVYAEADRRSNGRIRAYIERYSRGD